VRYDIAGPKPFQTFWPSSVTACLGRVASKCARKAALSEYSGFKAAAGGSGAGGELTRVSPDWGIDGAIELEGAAAVVDLGAAEGPDGEQALQIRSAAKLQQ